MFGILTASLVNRTLIRSTCVAQFATQAEYYNILVKYLKIDPVTAKTISLKSCRRLRLSKTNEIIRNCSICLEHNVSLTELEYISTCLELRNFTLENRIHLLKEIGVPNLNIKHVATLCYTIKKSARRFKQEHDIPAETNLALNIIRSFDKNVQCLPDLAELSNNDSVSSFCKVAESYFKTHVLPEKYAIIPLNKRVRSCQHRSLTLLLKTLHFLDNELNFSPKFIQTHSYLLNISITTARAVIAGLQDTTIDGLSFTDLLHSWPAVLSCDVDNVKTLLKLFKEYNIPQGAVTKCYEILTLEAGVFVERMLRIQNTPELKTWCNHPRILYLVLHARLISDRIQTLRTMHLDRYIEYELIFSLHKSFQTLLKHDKKSRNKKGLELFLRIEFGDLGSSLESVISKHPHWKSISVQHMQTILQYLKKYYTLKDIATNVHIILYPLDRIKSIREDSTYEKKYDFTPSQELAYILYVLEKDCNFSGNGVWHEDILISSNSRGFNKLINISQLKEIVDRTVFTKYSSTVNSGNVDGNIFKETNTESSSEEKKMVELKL